ncbi:6795_t:CDS:1, partial [Racocetra persica]
NKSYLENKDLLPEKSCNFKVAPGQVIQRSAKMSVKRKRLLLNIYIVEIESPNKKKI